MKKTITTLLLQLTLSSIFALLLFACGKNNNNHIDVSSQWRIDNSGQLITGITDGQWQNKSFNTQEQNLFASLDTANLAGTTKPDSVFEQTPLSQNYISPNPFNTTIRIAFRFTNGYSGDLVFKYVIVDNLLNALEKGAVSIHGTACTTCPLLPSSSNAIIITPKIPVGKCRLYYSLSAQSAPHFYKTWGNIEKAQ